MSTTADAPVAAAERAAAVPPRKPAAGKRQLKRGERPRSASVLIHTVLIAAAFIAAFPIAWIAWISLGPDKTDYLHPGDIADKISFENYTTVLGDTEFLQWFANSLIVALGTCLLGVFIAASSGYAVSRMRFPGHRQLMWTFLVTQMFPVAILMVPLYNILANLGLLDTYWALILVYCTTAIPYCAWLLKGYFDTIPKEIDEMAGSTASRPSAPSTG